MAPPRKLSLPGITAAAIALVDAQGLEALTMRSLGRALGVEAMSLYRYVRNKAALLDAVHDALLAEMAPEIGGEHWEADVRAVAGSFRAMLRAHPNAVPMFATRPARGLHALRQVETGLSILDAAGLPTATALATFQVLFAFVVGHALYTFLPDRDRDRDVDYAALPPAYPHLRTLPAVLATRDLDAEFELGLDMFIAGIRERAR